MLQLIETTKLHCRSNVRDDLNHHIRKKIPHIKFYAFLGRMGLKTKICQWAIFQVEYSIFGQIPNEAANVLETGQSNVGNNTKHMSAIGALIKLKKFRLNMKSNNFVDTFTYVYYL